MANSIAADDEASAALQEEAFNPEQLLAHIIDKIKEYNAA